MIRLPYYRRPRGMIFVVCAAAWFLQKPVVTAQQQALSLSPSMQATPGTVKIIDITPSPATQTSSPAPSTTIVPSNASFSALPSVSPSAVPVVMGAAGKYQCWPRDEVEFEWTAFAPAPVCFIMLAWLLYLRIYCIPQQQQNIADKSSGGPPAFIGIVSGVIFLLPLLFTWMEVALNQSKYGIQSFWVVPVMVLCLAAMGMSLARLPMCLATTSACLFGAGGVAASFICTSCREREVDPEYCNTTLNDEVIWFTGLTCMVLLLLIMCTIYVVCACLCHGFCSTKYVTYEGGPVHTDPPSDEMINCGALIMVMVYLVLVTVSIVTLTKSLRKIEDDPTAPPSCISVYGLVATLIAGICGIIGMVQAFITIRLFFPGDSDEEDIQDQEDEYSY